MLIDVAICRCKNESFRSLLQSNGIYFKNPISIKPLKSHYSQEDGSFQLFEDDFREWQSYESKLIKGKIIILKQK